MIVVYIYKIHMMDHTYFNTLNTCFQINYRKEAYKNKKKF